MKRIIAIGAALAALAIFGYAKPAVAVNCWYCSAANTCYKAPYEIGGKGGTSCSSGVGWCELSGACPLTVFGPENFDAGGSTVVDCTDKGPFDSVPAANSPVPVEMNF